MLRASKLAKNIRSTDTVEKLRLNLPAGEASNAPPLGPTLGARGIQSGIFVKQFNDMTQHIKPGTPIPVSVTIKGDRSFKINASTPPASHFLKQAAGLRRGSYAPGSVWVGQVNLKQIYEIAKVKHADTNLANISLENVCKCIIGSCRSMGMKVVK